MVAVHLFWVTAESVLGSYILAPAFLGVKVKLIELVGTKSCNCSPGVFISRMMLLILDYGAFSPCAPEAPRHMVILFYLPGSE